MPLSKCVFSRDGRTCHYEFSSDGHSLCVPHRPCVSPELCSPRWTVPSARRTSSFSGLWGRWIGWPSSSWPSRIPGTRSSVLLRGRAWCLPGEIRTYGRLCWGGAAAASLPRLPRLVAARLPALPFSSAQLSFSSADCLPLSARSCRFLCVCHLCSGPCVVPGPRCVSASSGCSVSA